MQDTLTPSEAAEWLTERGIPTTGRTVRRWCKDGSLPAVLLPSGRVRIPVASLTDLTSGGVKK